MVVGGKNHSYEMNGDVGKAESQGWESRVLPHMYVYLFRRMLDKNFCG